MAVESTHIAALLRAMCHRLRVRSDTGVVGHIDELYKSTRHGGVRARVCESTGRVHHFDVDDIELVGDD